MVVIFVFQFVNKTRNLTHSCIQLTLVSLPSLLFSLFLYLCLSHISSTAQNCSGLRTCAECLERAECGWCGDPSNTGKGVCMEGSYRGPLKPAIARAGPRDRDRLRDRDMVLDQSLCSSDRGYNWAFIQCPGQ